MKRIYNEIRLTEFESFIEKMKGQKYACIWDTSKVPVNPEVCEKLIRTNCKVIISIGPQADIVHDICDDVSVQIEIVEQRKSEIDTRGSKDRGISFLEAIEEMEHSLFPEDDASILYVAVNK